MTLLNRHQHPLPDNQCFIKILVKDGYGEQTHICEWMPFRPESYEAHTMPDKGYLGTAYITGGKHKGIGLHAWENNDFEFVYYEVVGL